MPISANSCTPRLAGKKLGAKLNAFIMMNIFMLSIAVMLSFCAPTIKKKAIDVVISDNANRHIAISMAPLLKWVKSKINLFWIVGNMFNKRRGVFKMTIENKWIINSPNSPKIKYENITSL